MRSKPRSLLPGLHWLLIAVGLCWLSWPAPAEAAPACAHSVCDVGGNLSEVCDPCIGNPDCTIPVDCVDTICSDPTDQNSSRFCCDSNGLWDQDCVDAVLEVCGNPTCEQVCSHSPCVTGMALDPTCNSCTALVCFNHPECCTDDGDPLTDPDWDAACVGYFEQECGIQCEPGENTCSNALPIGTGVIHGTLLESNNDGCASAEGSPGGVSCNSGDVWYSYTQGTAEDRVISTCTSQRSFAVDSVVSVHRGCPGKKNNEIVANDDWRLGNARDACTLGTPSPNNVDAGILLRANALDPGETVVIRVSHHSDSFRTPFELRVLPEPEIWLALVAGAGALGALSRRRARG